MTDPDPLLTIPDVMARLKCRDFTARRLMRDGIIPAALIGGRWTAKASAVDAYVDAQLEAAAPKVTRRRRRRA